MTNPYNYPKAKLKERLNNIEGKLSPDYTKVMELNKTLNKVQYLNEDAYLFMSVWGQGNVAVYQCNIDGAVQAPLVSGEKGSGVCWSPLVTKGTYFKIYEKTISSDNSFTFQAYPATGGITNV